MINRLITIWVFVFFCLTSSAGLAEEKLVFSTIEGSPLAKIASAVMSKVYERLGIPIEIYFTSGRRALVVSSTGNVDGELVRIGAVKDRYTTLRQVPVPNLEAKGLVFVREDDKDRIAAGDLSKLRVGYLDGVVQAARFTEGFKDVWLGQSAAELFQLLSSGKLDAVVSDRFDGPLTISRLRLTNIVPLGPPFQVEPMFHYIHEKNSYLVPKVAEVLSEMRGTGEIDVITDAVMDEMIAETQTAVAN
jgi:ABC-type amino acid transport substrate-binding protein